ncbi:hypothetical protein T05_3010 [Trichinella murrelli]|uniref:Uncharacterized protein n=1 Tax=Trichinella murrelli TaxID=144512 RepID=A0A0V0SS07_9BILA|nr:hypothetical protein T05_3010 [Trichinella murrelli]
MPHQNKTCAIKTNVTSSKHTTLLPNLNLEGFFCS